MICFLFYFLLVYLAKFSSSEYHYRTEYFDVPLDHFSFSNNKTFPLRYLVNDSYWEPEDGPIFFYTGNEGDIRMFAKNTGFMWESAPKFNALLVFAEHRYYGKSLPFGNLSLKESKYFGYLTVEQALADFVDLIYHLKYTRFKHIKSSSSNNAVIAFGGSYGGMLAAWIRMKYPAAVQGALASSAPIWQFQGIAPCNGYYKVLTEVFNSTSSTCLKNIQKSWDVINNLTKSANGMNWINQNWKLCDLIKTDSDVFDLKNWLLDVYGNVAMTNYPYPTNFLMPLPENPVKEMCGFLENSPLKEKDLLNSLFNAISIYFNYTGNAKCLQWKSDPSPDLGTEGWYLQTCMEMPMPMCADKNSIMEPFEWNFTSYSDSCYDKYKVRPEEYKIIKEYGGKDISAVSNIIFSNGQLDPWSSGGVNHSQSKSVITLFLKDSAHHLDLRSSNENDPQSIKHARRLYKFIFKRWIKEYQRQPEINVHLVARRKQNRKTRIFLNVS